MKTQTCTVVVPPNIQAMLTGACLARIFTSGKVELTYADSTTESATLTPAQLAEGREDFFRLVSLVQSYR